MNYTVLILTHIDKKTKKVLLPHIKWLLKSNPNIDYKIIIGEDSIHGQIYNWKNSDQVLRNWWKENSHSVKNEYIAVIEWDTLVACKLPEIPEEYDLVGAMKFDENPDLRGKWKSKLMRDPSWQEENWMWWPDIPKLNLKDNQRAIGLVSFGAMFMRKKVLDDICNECCDSIYREDILSELRFPTLASLFGNKVGKIDLPFVSWTDVKVGKKIGIYHSVDEGVALDYFS